MAQSRVPVSQRLPDFPWDSLAEATAAAKAHPEGLIDLSVGTPIDPVAPNIQLALAESAAVPGYPQTKGTPRLRRAIAQAMERRFGVTGLDADQHVLPVIGTKEAIAWLPTLLGVGEGHQVVIPELKEKVKSPELVARLEKLQRQEDDRQYQAMVADITATVSPPFSNKIL